METAADWKIFTGNRTPHDGVDRILDAAPPWRPFKRGKVTRERRLPDGDGSDTGADTDRGTTFQCDARMVEMVNAALYLRRPLLITGKPGTGKSSLIYAVAHELKLGSVLRWAVTSRTTLRQGLYEYDAIGRLQETQLEALRREHGRGPAVETLPEIGKYLKLGPLGTALLPTRRPWALLVDEIDKADIDLPNDLLNIFEEGEYEITELARLEKQPVVSVRGYHSDETFPIVNGHVRCHAFPFVILTSNGEREFPPPFLRRCLQLQLNEPDDALLARIVEAHLGPAGVAAARALIEDFVERRRQGNVATDQLLNAIYMVSRGGLSAAGQDEQKRVITALLRELSAFAGG